MAYSQACKAPDTCNLRALLLPVPGCKRRAGWSDMEQREGGAHFKNLYIVALTKVVWYLNMILRFETCSPLELAFYLKN